MSYEEFDKMIEKYIMENYVKDGTAEIAKQDHPSLWNVTFHHVKRLALKQASKMMIISFKDIIDYYHSLNVFSVSEMINLSNNYENSSSAIH